MSVSLLYSLTGVALFAIGLYAIAAHAHLLRKVLAVNVMGSGVFLLLNAIAYGNLDDAPDPVPHAMVLTGIVVAVSMTAVALSLATRVQSETGRKDLLDEESGHES
jgi:multicomponent Na+:H+ antiporter subunit C